MEGFEWREPPPAEVPEAAFIDQLVFARLKKLQIAPSELASDAEFLRRAFLDACGVLPGPEEARRFLEARGVPTTAPWSVPTSSSRPTLISLSSLPPAMSSATRAAPASGTLTWRRSSQNTAPHSSAAPNAPTATTVHSTARASRIRTARGTTTPSAKRSAAVPICSGT